MSINISEIRKTVVAVVGVVATIASTGLLHGTAEQIVDGILAVATVLGVYHVKNAAPALPPISSDDPIAVAATYSILNPPSAG